MPDKKQVETVGGKIYKIEIEFTGTHFIYRHGLVGKTKSLSDAIALIENDAREKVKVIT